MHSNPLSTNLAGGRRRRISSER